MEATSSNKPQILTPQQIDAIRSDPQATVMDVQYNEVERVMTMRELKPILASIRSHYLELRTQYPEETDENIRDRIDGLITQGKQLRETSHPRIYNIITDRSSTDQDLETIATLIRIRAEVDDGTITEEESYTKAVQSFMQLDNPEQKNK